MREYGFNKNIQGYKHLIKIFQDLDNVIEIIQGNLILPDNYQDYISNEDIKFLVKPFYDYRNKLFIKTYTRTEYNNYLKELKEKELQRKKKEEQISNSEKELLLQIQKKYQNKFRNNNWILNNIGEYYTEEQILPLFWTIIGDNYIKLPNGNIRLQKDIQDKIEEIDKRKLNINISGSQFLGRRFIVNGRSRGIEFGNPYIIKEEKVVEKILEDVQSNGGIYAIYKNDELFYIGSTMRDFSIRFKEHLEKIKIKSNELHLYSLINQEDDISFSPLIYIKDLKIETKITRRDLECMELALIHLYKPKGNLAGNTCKFRFKEE